MTKSPSTPLANPSGSRTKKIRDRFSVFGGMSRRLRFIPEGGALVEVTSRALHSRHLFRPSPLVSQIIIGTLARAKRRHKARVCFFVCASNHMHLLLWTEDARELSKFMGYFLSKLAREVGRLTGWKEKIFSRRYQAIGSFPPALPFVGG
jgi:hypothetical protein